MNYRELNMVGHSFCADAVRTQYGPMRLHVVIVFQTLFVCLSLVRVPESRVTRGSGFLGGWAGLFRGEVQGRVWFSETSGFLVSGLVPW